MKRNILTIVGLILLSTLVSCGGMQNNQQKGTAAGAGAGAGVGAIIGQAIGGDTESTLLGAGIGAAIGGIAGNQIGRYMDRQEQDLQNALSTSNAASIRRDENILRATFRGETYFDHDSTQLKQGAYPELRRVADVLNKYPQTRIEVAGHTDTTGSESYNRELSRKRAAAVRDVLVQNGVAQRRIQTVGYGESRPVSSDHAANRRVEIVIVPVEKQSS